MDEEDAVEPHAHGNGGVHPHARHVKGVQFSKAPARDEVIGPNGERPLQYDQLGLGLEDDDLLMQVSLV